MTEHRPRDGAFFVSVGLLGLRSPERSNPWKPSRVLRKGKHAHSRPERRLRAPRRRVRPAGPRPRHEPEGDRRRRRCGTPRARGGDVVGSPVGHRADAVRAHPAHPADPRLEAGRHAPRLAPVRLLRSVRDDDRPRAAAVAGRGGQLGEPRRVLPQVQQPQERPHPARDGLGAALHAQATARGRLGRARHGADAGELGRVPRRCVTPGAGARSSAHEPRLRR
ncbi:hypothetical protein FRIGORI9N_420032 [Frigoribacterium sp. 9N]|nr:hypothetical protein FRIGORI9N_420032 [Frigoribacterium sp. 9N]